MTPPIEPTAAPERSPGTATAAGSAGSASSAATAPATRLSVTHCTTYRYSTPVETAQHLATVRPLTLPWQTVLHHHENIMPSPSYRMSRDDAFGNSLLYFSLAVPHDILQLIAETTVLLTPRWNGLLPERTPPWETVAASMRFTAGARFAPETAFCFASPHIELPHAPMRDYAATSFLPGRPIADAAIDLMHRLHRDLRYEPAATAYNTPAHLAFAMRHGVCQDFAQIMIGCVRAMGLPARYVSGYLRNDPPPGQPRLVGADASHAWAAMFCPGLGWLDLDPTNDMLADVSHVTLAIGRDYTDVSLLRGMILGGGVHRVEVQVDVRSG